MFNFFPPHNLIAGTTLNGPEFAIFNTNTALSRVNFRRTLSCMERSAAATKVDFTPVVNAGTPDQMVDWLNTYLLHGTMSSQMKTERCDGGECGEYDDTKKQAKDGDLSGDFVVAVSGAEVGGVPVAMEKPHP